jgi:RNA-directed DNA polymerase
MTPKPYDIPKALVWEAFQNVKDNGGAAGIDQQTIEQFEERLGDNLYKLWNRMCSGSYFPSPVKAVPIPKKTGGVRVLGVPTVADRVAQTVVKLWLEPKLDPLFHADSYGYRPGRSADDAIAVNKRRCWELDWVVEFDIKGLFDNIDHDLLMRAVRKHCQTPWVSLYVERWLKAPLQTTDDEVRARVRGTPQGGVVSPLLANLFLHYAFDVWVERTLSSVRFCRYADDAIIHCNSQAQAQFVLRRIDERFRECGFELHPNKTRIMYCKDVNRQQDHPEIELTFLGYTFRPRKTLDKHGRVYVDFFPGGQRCALAASRQRARSAALPNSFRRCYGPSYISADLAEWLDKRNMGHVRGAPCHPQTQGKIERWHQTLKNRILLENYYLPGDLAARSDTFADHYNHRRYHENEPQSEIAACNTN